MYELVFISGYKVTVVELAIGKQIVESMTVEFALLTITIIASMCLTIAEMKK